MGRFCSPCFLYTPFHKPLAFPMISPVGLPHGEEGLRNLAFDVRLLIFCYLLNTLKCIDETPVISQHFCGNNCVCIYIQVQ